MRLFTAFAVTLLLTPVVHALEWRGSVSFESTYFPESSVGTDNFNFSTSVGGEVELTKDLADNVRFTFQPFFRIDQRDEERSRLDARELFLTTGGDTWEFNAGLATVFWGVTESHNPVDIINQTDSIEDFDNDEKLGQLMLNLRWFSDFGDFDLYLMPQFEERTFTGPDGRPFLGVDVDPALTTFESSQGSNNIDVALRWIRSFDVWDIGLHYFDGTRRDPTLIPTLSGTTLALAPRYSLIQQFGLDAQGLYGDLAVKTEVIHQDGNEIDAHFESVSGIEYTLVGFLSPLQDQEKLPESFCTPDTLNPIKLFVCNDRMDLGLVFEYLWDERGLDSNQIFQNDILAGFRFAFNDTATSDALIGFIADLDGGATTLSIEASTRLLESYRLSVLGRKFFDTAGDPIVSPFENESFLQLEISYFF